MYLSLLYIRGPPSTVLLEVSLYPLSLDPSTSRTTLKEGIRAESVTL